MLRLAKLAGSAASSRNNYRVTDSGAPMGLLMGTPTFKMCYQGDEQMEEIEKMLRMLESGSSSRSRITGALKDFQEVLTVFDVWRVRTMLPCIKCEACVRERSVTEGFFALLYRESRRSYGNWR